MSAVLRLRLLDRADEVIPPSRDTAAAVLWRRGLVFCLAKHTPCPIPRLGQLDAAGASRYRANARRFAEAVDRRLPDWQARLADAPGIVLYHRDAVYLLERSGVPLLGTIEPVPGVPPSRGGSAQAHRRAQGT